jgi:ABC-type Co2+ transport system permease subunit
MHIEPGYLAASKILFANVSAVGVLAYYSRFLLARPADIVRGLLAALFFSVFMQSFHMNVGPSELHFVGAMAMYLTLGFAPTLFGFAAGLLLQGLLFEPADLVHLAVNSLSLIVPLVGVHYTLGRRYREGAAELRWRQIVQLDAMYYSGLAVMVGFWLSLSEVSTPVMAWATWASSYLAVVVFEPLFTYATLRLLKRHQDRRWVELCFAVKPLRVAA